MGIVFDLIALAIIIIMALVGMKKGFISTVISVAKWVAALMIASIFAGAIAGFVYDNFIENGIVEKINEYMPETASMEEFSGLDLSLIKEKLQKINIKMNENDTEENTSETVSEIKERIKNGDSMAQAISRVYIRPVYLNLIRPICYSILFILVLIVGIILEKVFNITNVLPLVGGLNKFLGCVTGIIYGAIIVTLVCAVTATIISLTNNSLPWLNNNTFDGTAVRFIMGLGK